MKMENKHLPIKAHHDIHTPWSNWIFIQYFIFSLITAIRNMFLVEFPDGMKILSTLFNFTYYYSLLIIFQKCSHANICSYIYIHNFLWRPKWRTPNFLNNNLAVCFLYCNNRDPSLFIASDMGVPHFLWW